MPGIGSLWRQRDFALLWSAQTVSMVGSQVSGIALPLVAILVLHASTFAVAAVGVVEFLPFVLLTLPAGVWVDRLRRRPLLIVGDAARAVLLAYIPIAWALGILDIWQLMALQFVIGIFTVFFDIAYQSYLPSLVDRDQLVEGNSKLQTTVSAAQIGGPGLAGVLIGVLTAPYAIALDAASFLVSTAFMLPIRAVENVPQHVEGQPKPKMLPELKEGLAYVVRHRHLKWIATCTGTSNFFGQIAFSIVILYMARTLHISSFWAGAVFAGFGVGSILAALTTTRLQKAVGVGPAIWLTAVVFSVSGLAFPLAPTSFPVPVLLAGTFIAGYGGMAYNISQVSLRQAITPERLQGRMNATMRWIVWGTIPLGTIAGGAIATVYSLRAALWVGAIGALFSFLPVLLSSVRSIREMPEPMAEPTPIDGIVEPTTSATVHVDARATGDGGVAARAE
jgi:MFS family permease